LIGTDIVRTPKAFGNICVLDRVLVFQRSRIGQNANSQMSELKQRYQNEINAEKRTLDQTGRAATPNGGMPQLLERVQNENARLAAVRARAQTLVIQRIAPEIRRQSVAFRCATVLDRSTVVDQGQATDITSEVVKGIDKNVPTLPIGTLEHWVR
jgi:Skp family chaperone for outer membrane proteins